MLIHTAFTVERVEPSFEGLEGGGQRAQGGAGRARSGGAVGSRYEERSRVWVHKLCGMCIQICCLQGPLVTKAAHASCASRVKSQVSGANLEPICTGPVRPPPAAAPWASPPLL